MNMAVFLSEVRNLYLEKSGSREVLTFIKFVLNDSGGVSIQAKNLPSRDFLKIGKDTNLELVNEFRMHAAAREVLLEVDEFWEASDSLQSGKAVAELLNKNFMEFVKFNYRTKF